MNLKFLSFNTRTSLIATAVTLLLLGMFGCRNEETVRRFQVEKARSGLSSIKPFGQSGMASNRSTGAASQSGGKRMVVAIALKENATWFFKVLASATTVELAQKQLRTFFESADFDEAGNPKFDLPEGWTETPSKSMMRFSTIKFSVDGQPLEIAISSLAPNQDLLSNVNRWRGQLQLSPLTADSMKLEKVESAGGQLLIYDDVGGGSPSTSMPRAPGRATSQLQYDIPDGWTKGRSSQIVKVRLLKEQADQKVQISVTELPASMNKWAPNVDRWLGELGMVVEDKEEFLADNATELTMDGANAQKVRMISDDDEIKRATIAIMAIRDDSAWFFKMSGPRDMVAAGENEFDEFVGSFRFE